MRCLIVVTLGILTTLAGCAPDRPESAQPVAATTEATPPDTYLEYDVFDLQEAMAAGSLSAAELVDFYLARIEALDQNGPRLRSVIEINPEAREIAEALDEERRNNAARGPLHGIPILLKANIKDAKALRHLIPKRTK